MDGSNLRSFSMRPQKLKNNHAYPSASGCAGPKIVSDLPRRPVDLVLQSMKVSTTFSAKKLSELEKKCSAIFYSRSRLKFELTSENGGKTSNTGSKSYF